MGVNIDIVVDDVSEPTTTPCKETTEPTTTPGTIIAYSYMYQEYMIDFTCMT